MNARQVFHDYPRLARESGFHIKMRARCLNLSDIGELDLDDIAEKGRWEELESRLDLVESCELRGEAAQLLDRGLLGLFRLAQLQVTYLRHCLVYLDRCVLVLQQQLTAALEGNGRKQEVQRNSSPLSSEKAYKCTDCRKVFMSSSYLSSHVRRRHSIVSPEPPSKTVVEFKEGGSQTDRTETKDAAVGSPPPALKDASTGTEKIQNAHVGTSIEVDFKTAATQTVEEFRRESSSQTDMPGRKDASVGTEGGEGPGPRVASPPPARVEEEIRHEKNVESLLERLLDQLHVHKQDAVVEEKSTPIKQPKPAPRRRQSIESWLVNCEEEGEEEEEPNHFKELVTSTPISPIVSQRFFEETTETVSDDLEPTRSIKIEESETIKRPQSKTPKMASAKSHLSGLRRKWTALFPGPAPVSEKPSRLTLVLRGLGVDPHSSRLSDSALGTALQNLERSRRSQQEKTPEIASIRRDISKQVEQRLHKNNASTSDAQEEDVSEQGVEEILTKSFSARTAPVAAIIETKMNSSVASHSKQEVKTPTILPSPIQTKQKEEGLNKPQVKPNPRQEVKAPTTLQSPIQTKQEEEGINRPQVKPILRQSPKTVRNAEENRVSFFEGSPDRRSFKSDEEIEEIEIDIDPTPFVKNTPHQSPSQKLNESALRLRFSPSKSNTFKEISLERPAVRGNSEQKGGLDAISLLSTSSSESGYPRLSSKPAESSKKLILSDKTVIDLPAALTKDVPSPGSSSNSSDWDV